MKLNEEQIAKLKELQQKNNQLSLELGNLLRQQWMVETMIQKGKELIEEVSKEESELMKALEEEYGKGSVNLETFEFTPQEA
jgi:seryl-tRNA synthetase